MKKILFVVILFLVIACTPKPDVNTYTVGFISPLSGPAAQYGEPALNGAKLALQEINSRGINNHNLELIVEDGACDPRVAATVATRMIHEQGVDIILGGHCSPESLAIAPIAEQNKVILFASATTAPDYSHAGDYIFRNSPINTEGRVVAEDMNTQGFERAAVIAQQTGYALPVRDLFEETFSGVVSASEEFVGSETDFKTSVTKIQESDPDAVFIVAQGIGPALLIMKQMLELGMDVPLYGNAVFDTPELVESLGEDAEKIKIATLEVDLNDPEVKEFIDKYKAKHGIEPPLLAHTLDSAAAVYIIAEALEACGEDNSCIKDFLYAYDHKKTLAGTISIDENGDADKPFVLKQVVDGKIV